MDVFSVACIVGFQFVFGHGGVLCLVVFVTEVELWNILLSRVAQKVPTMALSSLNFSHNC